jgi:hypothetical protein
LLILCLFWKQKICDQYWRPSHDVEVIWILTLINNIHFMNYGSVNQLVISLWIMACYNLLTTSILQWTIGPLECVNFFFFNFSFTHKRKCNKPKAAVIQNNQIQIYSDREYYTKFWKGSIPKLCAPKATWKGSMLLL